MSRPGAKRASKPIARDMDPTPFAAILGGLLTRLPGARAAALVDYDGETVDYAGVARPYDLRFAAAHVRILLDQLDRLSTLGETRWLAVRGVRASVLGRKLPERYALVVTLSRRAGFTGFHRAFSVCARELAVEAGWAPESLASEPRWWPVEVEVDAAHRPRRLGASQALQILGSVVGLPRGERGFRVRTDGGNEVTLVRESPGRWYADVPT